MKSNLLYLAVAALIIGVGAALLYQAPSRNTSAFFSPNPVFSEELKTLLVGDYAIRVAIADSPTERTQGLSGTTMLPQGTGMLFVFPSPHVPGFWMKDMLFPIDIIWISSAGEVVGVVPRATPESFPTQFRPDQPIQYVLEVPAGFAETYNVQKGVKISVEIAL